MSSERGIESNDLCTRWPKIQQMDHKITPEKENSRKRVMDHKDMFAINTMLIMTVPLFYRLSSSNSSYRLPYPHISSYSFLSLDAPCYREKCWAWVAIWIQPRGQPIKGNYKF